MKNLLTALAISSGLVTTAFAGKVDYTYATFSPDKALSPAFFLNGFNHSGQAVGYFFERTSGIAHGFMYDSGNYTTIDVADPSTTVAKKIRTQLLGINDSGQIAGGYYDISDVLNAFVYINHSFIPINVPFAIWTAASGIANNGLVVGDYADWTGAQHGFIYNGKTYQVLPDIPNGYNIGYRGINNHGDVVGTFDEPYSNDNNRRHGFLYKNGIYNTIDFPNALHKTTGLNGINDNGQVVGSAVCMGDIGSKQCNDGDIFGFVYDGNTYETLDLPQSKFALPIDINNNGVVAGTLDFPNGREIFTATPNTSGSASVCHPNVTYNFWSLELVIQDIMVNGFHYWAKLNDQGNFNFKLTDFHEVAAGTCPDSEVIHYSNNVAIIPSVLAYGSDYKVTLEKNKVTGLYSMMAHSINRIKQ